MKKFKLMVAAGALAATAALIVPAAAYAAETPAPPVASDTTEDAAEITVTPIEVMPEGTTESKSAAGVQAICQAYGIVDYAHISTSNPSGPTAVQSHGGWNKGNCSATKADVTTQIDRKNPIGLFQAVGTQGRGILNSQADFGLPSSNRVTARYPCNGHAAAPFRSWTSFDMIGIADTHTPTYSPATGNIACG